MTTQHKQIAMAFLAREIETTRHHAAVNAHQTSDATILEECAAMLERADALEATLALVESYKPVDAKAETQRVILEVVAT